MGKRRCGRPDESTAKVADHFVKLRKIGNFDNLGGNRQHKGPLNSAAERWGKKPWRESERVRAWHFRLAKETTALYSPNSTLTLQYFSTSHTKGLNVSRSVFP